MPEEDTGSVIDEAIAEAQAEVAEETPAEETVEAAPVEEAAVEEPAEEAEPEAEPEAEEEAEPEEEENPLGLSAEELAEVNADPKLQRAYKSMQRGLTAKATQNAEAIKAAESAEQLVNYIKADPEKALQDFADARGYQLTKPATPEAEAQAGAEDASSEAVDAIVSKYAEKIGPESAKLLIPMMQEVAQMAAQNAVTPVATQAQTLIADANRSSIAAATAEFGAEVTSKGGEWTPAVQQQMADVMSKVVASESTTLHDYMSLCHKIVVSENTSNANTKRELTRLRKAKDTAEPTRSVRPTPKTEEDINSMSERDAIAAATRWAEAQVNG